MPVTPPDPLKILETLRAVLEELEALARATPTDARGAAAGAAVTVAIRVMESPGLERTG